MKTQGVAFLNTEDEKFLLRLTCAERLEDLDNTATAVARLGRRCTESSGLNGFDLVYTNLKVGIVDSGQLEYGSREIEKKVKNLGKLISGTCGLYASLEALAEMEIGEKRTRQWKERANMEMHIKKLEYQRKLVKYYKQISLWSQSFDHSVGLMAQTVCVIYARICSVFRPFVPILPSLSLHTCKMLCPKEWDILMIRPKHRVVGPVKEKFSSGSDSGSLLVQLYSIKSGALFGGANKNNRILHAAGPTTLGGSGLALRYANVVQLLEKYLSEPVDEESRKCLYQMLPENLRSSVRSKLSKSTRSGARGDAGDLSLAEGWREAMRHIMEWLAPMAHNTVTWQMERKFDKKMKFETKPAVLSWQTLHFSDVEKTEAAIVEVLVGLSCICRYEKCR